MRRGRRVGVDCGRCGTCGAALRQADACTIQSTMLDEAETTTTARSCEYMFVPISVIWVMTIA